MNYYLAILFWLHLIGISIWMGASFLLPLVIMPAAQGLDPAARLQFAGALSRRLAPWVMGSILVVVLTGILQTGAVFKTFTIFLGINILTIKVLVAILMIANGTYIGMILPRRVQALAPKPGAPPSPEFLRTLQQQVRHGWIQAGMGVVVLLLVGLLTAG